jgi:YD repeat-containing protein
MKNTLITAAFLAISFSVAAQDEANSLGEYAIKAAYAQFKMKKVIPPSPEAANLGKYGNVPVSLFTGTPQISIPLASIGQRYPLNISLSYNNSGFKPGEPASWVGLGWNLNAGGVITKSVVGNPDMDDNYFSQQNLVLPTNNDLFGRYDMINQMRSGAIELQSDVYFYNVGAMSGKFYIKRDGTIIKKTKDNTIISVVCLNCSTNSWFTIVDEKGYTFEFKDFERSTTVNDPQPSDVLPRQPDTYNSSWYLTKITSPDGKEVIDFEYHDLGGSIVHKTLNSNIQSQSITFQYANNGTTTSSTAFGDISQNEVRRKRYISKISVSSLGQVISYVNFESVANQREDLFNGDYPEERLLKKVQVFQKNGFGNTFLMKQEIELGYSYFIDPVSPVGEVGRRLRLDFVRENAVDGITPNKPPYQLTYNPFQSGCTNPMAVDHWGYANGFANGTLIPSVNINGTIFGLGSGGVREANYGSALGGVIKSITYPTGGYTEFTWEGHDGFDSEGYEIFAGGLRIKAISDFNATGDKSSLKRFAYLKPDGVSSGRAARPNYISLAAYNYFAENTLGISTDEDKQYSRLTIAASPVLALGSVQGSHIGYSRVVEEQVDITDANPLGSTVYEYNIANFDPYNDDISNGDLIKQSDKDNNGKVLREVFNEYSYFVEGGIAYQFPVVEPIQESKRKLCQYLQNGEIQYEWQKITETDPTPCIASRWINTRYNFGGYSVVLQSKQLARQEQRVFDKLSNSYISSVKTFTYGNPLHTYPTRIEQVGNNTEIIGNEIKYPKDYSNYGTDQLGGSISSLNIKNIVGFEVENLQYRRNADGSNKRYINGELSLIESGIYPTKLYRLETISPVASVVSSTINGGGQFVYDNLNFKQYASLVYDNVGNLIQQNKVSDMVSTYIWDHKQTLPTAEIVNADSSMVAYSSFESDDLGGFTEIPNLNTSRVAGGFSGGYAYSLAGGNFIKRLNLPPLRTYVISYWSKNGQAYVSVGPGMAPARTDLNGKVHNGWTYYEHTIASPGFVWVSGTATIDELRIYPADGLMNTISYSSFDGLTTSRVDPSNKKVDFDYDVYSRLVNIRDEDRNIVKNFAYQYGTNNTIVAPTKTLYYNNPAQAVYYRQGCPAPAEPLAYTYVVPFGKHAATSQSVANGLANTDVIDNGQVAANVNGRCVYWNEAVSYKFYKNDCLPEQGTSTCPKGVTYTVPAHTIYASSLPEANDLAWAQVWANGQNYANSTCSCTCIGPNKKFINGVCETGLMVYTGFQTTTTCGSWGYLCFYKYVFSDGSSSPTYSECSMTPCSTQ